MTSLAPRDVLVGLLAVRRGLLANDELDSVLLSSARDDSESLAESLRRRLGAVTWAELLRSADQQLSDAGSIPASEIPPPHPAATVVEKARQPGPPSLTPATVSPDEWRTEAPGEQGLAPAAPRYSRSRRHAEGGLGVIFAAWDEELGREVALKEIKERHADRPGSRARFVFEAEVTGRLEHPGIVPVYGLGTYSDGRPFYAMRFIKGHTLDQAIQRFHEADRAPREPGERALALRDLLGRFVGVCQAVAYAHSKGIIHRDIKPANVMLGEFGETLLVDWGLAKALGIDQGPQAIMVPPSGRSVPDSVVATGETPRSPGGTELGAVVGTPSYMPPEQALGDADLVGPRSDVYSLGATLYHLLAGRAPVEEGAVELTLEKVVKGDVAPPRAVNPRVPAALEAVCHKAMALEPNDRYACAEDLAREVERFLADEPVLAYPEPATVRLRRWAKRNRPLVASAVVLLLAGLVGLSAGLWAVDRERKETARQRDEAKENLKRALAAEKDANEQRDLALAAKKDANEQRDRALAAQKEAKENFDSARKAVDECFGLAQKHPLLQEPGVEPIKKLLLEKTSRFYKDFRARRPDDPELAFARAEYLVRLGYVTSEIDRKDKALASYLEALQELRDLVARHPDKVEYQASLAEACNDAGSVMLDVGKFADARKHVEEARERFAALSRDHPRNTDYKEGQAIACQGLGVVLAQTAPREALKRDEEALRLFRELSKAAPGSDYLAASVATLINNVGKQKMETGDLESAREHFELALERLDALVEKSPRSARYRTRQAEVCSNLGLVFALATGKQEEAAKYLERARRIFLELSRTHPDVTDYKAALARTFVRALVEAQQGKSKEALKSYSDSIQALEGLCEEHPEVVRFRFELAVTCNDAGEVYRQSGRWKEALEHFARARDLLAELHQAHPDVVGYQVLLGTASNNVALVKVQLGQLDDAEKTFAESRGHLEAALREWPDDMMARLGLVLAVNNLSYLSAAKGRAKEALEAAAAAIDKGEALVKACPALHQGRHVLAMAHLNHGRALLTMGDLDGASKSFDRGLAVSRKLMDAHPGVREYQGTHAMGCCFRGFVSNVLGKYEEARKSAQEARELLEPLHEAQPEIVTYAYYLGISCYVLGVTTSMAGDNEGGLAYGKKAAQLLGALAEKNPDSADYRAGAAWAEAGLGVIHMQGQRTDEAEKHLSRALKAFRALAKDHPQSSEYQITQGQLATVLGVLYVASDRAAEGRKRADEAIPILKLALEKFPKNAQLQALYALAELVRGMALVDEKDPKGAGIIREAQKRLIALDKQGQLQPPQRIFLAMSCKVLGILAANEDRFEEGIEQFDQMRAVLTSLVESLPKATLFRHELVDAYLLLGACQGELKRLASARRSLRQARKHAQRLCEDAPDAVAFRAKLGAVDLSLAKALDERDEALLVLDEAVEALAAVCKAEPKNVQYLGWHKQARLLRAALLEQMERFLEAVPDMEVVVALEKDPDRRVLFRQLRARLLAEAGDHRRFGEAADELYRDRTLPAATNFTRARFLAESAGMVAGDPSLPLPQREKDSERYFRQALDLLRRYERAGLLTDKDLRALKRDKDFTALRRHPAFRKWLAAVEEDRDR
jgi:serine/threonine-protein kinase